MHSVDPLLAPLARPAFRRFLAGFVCPFRAVVFLLRHPRLLGHVIAPAAISLVLLALALWASVKFAPAALGLFWRKPSGWHVAFWYLAAILTGFLLAMLALALAYGLAGLIATPFNDLLSERVIELVWTLPDETRTLRFILGCTLTSLGHSLLNLGLYLLVTLSLLLLNFIPVLGSIVFFAASMVATVFFLARDMLDGPLTLKRLSYRQKLHLVRRERSLVAGLGAATALLMWVPVLNLLLLPLAVVGGSLLYCRMEANGLVPEPAARMKAPLTA